jgi:prolyl 4-hydroxylase
MNNIVIIPDFYTPDECRTELWYAERTGFKEQKYGVTHTTEARRRTQSDDPERAAKIYSKLTLPALETFYKDLHPDPFEDVTKWKPIGLNERLRYYQYWPGQRFSRHFDIMFRINDNTRTFLTFIVYLDDDFEGGQTIFDNEIISPKMGSAILFPHELKHEGAVVTKGCKTVLRSDVVYTWTPNESNA